MNKKALNKAKKKLRDFQARGSNCPLCGKPFRNGCNHSITQAIERLEQNVINALIKKRIKL